MPIFVISKSVINHLNITVMQYVYNLSVHFSIGKSSRVYRFDAWSFNSSVSESKKMLFLNLLQCGLLTYNGLPIQIDSYYSQSVFCETNDITAPYYTPNYISSLLDEQAYLFDHLAFNKLVMDFISDLEDFGFEVEYFTYQLSDLDNPFTKAISNIYKTRNNLV